MKPKDKVEIFVFALFNENKKEGEASERNFGIFNGDGSKVYDVDLSCQFCSNGGTVGFSEKVSGGYNRGPSVWCVAKPHADEKVLQAVLDFCCGPGGVDCREVYESGDCFQPDKLLAHASYAMNAYYQMHGRNYWNCDFKGTGLVTFGDPSKNTHHIFSLSHLVFSFMLFLITLEFPQVILDLQNTVFTIKSLQTDTHAYCFFGLFYY
jgi:hypothetical protein